MGNTREGIVDNERVAGYRHEPDVSPTSNTETFVALKLLIDNWRWAGVPFYLRTGKSLALRATEIVIQFRRTPFVLFRNTAVKNVETNRLVIHIQPDEGISLSFGAKVPGAVMRLGLVNMDFDYKAYFGVEHGTGYERLLRDCMAGDATLFQRADMVEAGWKVIQPVLDVWHALPPRGFPNYSAGSWGPVEAEELLERDGRSWRRIGEEDIDLRGRIADSQKGRYFLMSAPVKRKVISSPTPRAGAPRSRRIYQNREQRRRNQWIIHGCTGGGLDSEAPLHTSGRGCRVSFSGSLGQNASVFRRRTPRGPRR